jgi:MYXO-CTERM domain-containing protein
MKNFSGSLSRLVVSASTLGVTMFAAPAVADMGVTTGVTRLATAAGLTDNYLTGQVGFGSGGTLISATRPNGQSNWSPFSSSTRYQISTPQGPGFPAFLTGAEIDSWMDSNARGTFSSTWTIDGGTYPGTYQSSMDTSPYYVAPTAMTYMELTQSSIALFNDIVANGRTGTFTFNTTQDFVNPAGQSPGAANIQVSSGFYSVYSPSVSSGNTFTVNIASVLSAGARLSVNRTGGQVGFPEITNYPFVGTARYNYNTSTMYTVSPVPAPGALALLALAGAAGGRRRRG